MTEVMSMQKVMVTEVRTQLSRFQTITPVNSLMALKWCTKYHRRCALLFLKVICQILRSRETKKIFDFDPNWAFPSLLQFEFTDVYEMMLNRTGALLFSKVLCQILRSQGTKKLLISTRIESFRTVTPGWIHPWLWNNAQSLTWYRRGALLFIRSSIKFQGHTGWKITRPVVAIKSLRFAFVCVCVLPWFGGGALSSSVFI